MNDPVSEVVPGTPDPDPYNRGVEALLCAIVFMVMVFGPLLYAIRYQ